MRKKAKVKDLSSFTVDLTEAVASEKILEEEGVIKDVVILTSNKVSKNRTNYTDKTLQEGVTRYEGAKMFLDHPGQTELKDRRGNRSIRDLAGTYRNLRVNESKLLGDLHVMDHYKPMVIGIAKKLPKGVGLSIRDRGLVQEGKDGVLTVEGFQGKTFSIDFVTDVSVNEDLFESTNNEGGEDDMDWSKITLRDLKENRTDLVEELQSEAKNEMAKDLKEAGEKSLRAEKLVLLAEAKMDQQFKDSIKPAVLKAEVTIEEAKTVIEGQVKLFESLNKDKNTKKVDRDPTVKGAKGKDVTEDADKDITDDQFLQAVNG